MASRLWAALTLLVLAACGGEERPEVGQGRSQVSGRVVTLDLWAGTQTSGATGLPRLDVRTPGGVTILGPVQVEDPVNGRPVQAYDRVSAGTMGRRRQLLTVTQGGAGLGRLLDHTGGLPERRYSGDVLFPLGLWMQGEIRRFEATEHTLIGPALRLVELEILDLDFVHDGVAHSLAFRLTIRDEAGRILDCERAVYSPGIGLVRMETGGHWLAQSGCVTCPCPG